MKNAKIGFMPLYIKLYDDVGLAELRERLEPFYETMAKGFEEKGIEVVRSPFCRIESEFRDAVARFESENVDCIVTWHAAYSPSLESAKILAETDLPIIVMDTTETYDFGPAQDSAEINLCHGIHGVMDMTNLLMRAGKPYAIAAGHYPTSDVMDRVIGYIKAARAARALPGSKVGTIGGSFDEMGDFLVSDEEMKSLFGVEVVYSGKDLVPLKASVTDDEVKAEIAKDLDECVVLGDIDPAVHYKTARNCLAVRRWIEEKELDAFTVNFRKIIPEDGLEIMPFMEACKAMARGTGYAGEGDVLTAAFTGALIKGFTSATFVEIFCPDWRGGSVLLSHMGEYNRALSVGKSELKQIPFVFGDADEPVVTYGRYMPGEAVFCNVFRTPEGFSMLTAPVTMLDTHEDHFEGTVRGWMKPHMPLPEFLEKISRAGVTHHSSLVYGATTDEIEFFAKLVGLKTVSI